jgi:predicted NBD/HSP70 family sugar kinase
MAYVLFDIGGTKTRIGYSVDGASITDHVVIATPGAPGKFLTALANYLEKNAITEISGVAGGIRGVLTEDHSGVAHDHILTKWIDFNLVLALEELHGVPATIQNDTAVAGLGEALYGAGQGIDLLVYHTISTGVGGAKIENGAIDVASVGFEPGHQVLDIDRTILGEDIVPTLENLVSGTAVELRMGQSPKDIPQDDVIWDELAEYLAQGLRNTILYWSPEAIILGGAMMVGDPRIPIEKVRKEVVKALDDVVPAPFITLATLGDLAGLHGALVMAKNTQNNA